MKFGDYLKQKRAERGWTQPEAASHVKIEQSYLSKLENVLRILENWRQVAVRADNSLYGDDRPVHGICNQYTALKGECPKACDQIVAR